MAKKKQPKVGEFVEIGDSPVSGITLRQILPIHTGRIQNIAWAPNGNFIASDISNGFVDIWDIRQGKIIKQLDNGGGLIYGMDWSPNSDSLLTINKKGTVHVWNIWSDSNFVIHDHGYQTVEDRYFGNVTWLDNGKKNSVCA